MRKNISFAIVAISLVLVASLCVRYSVVARSSDMGGADQESQYLAPAGMFSPPNRIKPHW